MIDARARALALCQRARAAIDCSRELAARTASCEVRIAEAQADMAAARRTRMAQRAAQTRTLVPWARAALGFARAFPARQPIQPQPRVLRAPPGGGLTQSIASGRVVRRTPRRRQASAGESAEGASDGADGERPPHPGRAQSREMAERVGYDVVDWSRFGDAALIVLSEKAS